MTALLIRNPQEGKGVPGRIELPFGGKYGTLSYETLENADFLIPEGTYPLQMTWSPKFRKFMPEISDVPEREGIRIHLGTRPEHSEGCVLVGKDALTNIIAFINYSKRYDYEETSITIRNGLDQSAV